MMAFADGWGWVSWLALALPLIMFVIVVGGAGYMIWRTEESEDEPPGEDDPLTGGAPRG